MFDDYVHIGLRLVGLLAQYRKARSSYSIHRANTSLPAKASAHAWLHTRVKPNTLDFVVAT